MRIVHGKLEVSWTTGWAGAGAGLVFVGLCLALGFAGAGLRFGGEAGCRAGLRV